jgi:hypothetical protein
MYICCRMLEGVPIDRLSPAQPVGQCWDTPSPPQNFAVCSRVVTPGVGWSSSGYPARVSYPEHQMSYPEACPASCGCLSHGAW